MRGRSFGTVASAMMPGKFKAALGSAASSTSGTTLAFTLIAAVAIDDLVVVRWAADNLSATTPTATCADGSNTYTNRAFLGVNATAAAGVVGGIFVCRATVARTTANSITLTFSGAVVQKSMAAFSFTGFQNALRGAAVTASGSSLAPSVTSASASSGDLIIGNVSAEMNVAVTADADTTGGAWSALTSVNSAAGGTADLAVSCHSQYKITRAAGTQIFNPTLGGTATDWTAQAIVIPPI